MPRARPAGEIAHPQRLPPRETALCLAARTAPGRTPLSQTAIANAAPSGRSALEAWRAASPALLFGLRLWAAVSIATYVAFWLELTNAFWAGTSAAFVCQPSL